MWGAHSHPHWPPHCLKQDFSPIEIHFQVLIKNTLPCVASPHLRTQFLSHPGGSWEGWEASLFLRREDLHGPQVSNCGIFLLQCGFHYPLNLISTRGPGTDPLQILKIHCSQAYGDPEVWHLQRGLGNIPVWNLEEPLSGYVDNTELDGLMV